VPRRSLGRRRRGGRGKKGSRDRIPPLAGFQVAVAGWINTRLNRPE
jgi:hypothetical protein